MIHQALSRKARAWRTLADAIKARAPEVAKLYALCADEIDEISAAHPAEPPSIPCAREVGRRRAIHAVMDTLKPGQWVDAPEDGLMPLDDWRRMSKQLSEDVARMQRRYWPGRRYATSAIVGYPPQIGRKL
jgi:hypothetical protein